MAPRQVKSKFWFITKFVGLVPFPMYIIEHVLSDVQVIVLEFTLGEPVMVH